MKKIINQLKQRKSLSKQLFLGRELFSSILDTYFKSSRQKVNFQASAKDFQLLAKTLRPMEIYVWRVIW